MLSRGLWVPEPTWDATAQTFHWYLDCELGLQSGSLEQFSAAVRELVERDLADILERNADLVERRAVAVER